MDKSHDQKSSSPLTTSPLACVTREYGGASPLSSSERETESGGGGGGGGGEGGGGGDGDGGGGCHKLAVGGGFCVIPLSIERR